MRVQTTASWQVEDLEKAQQLVSIHLAFDPILYEAISDGLHDDDPERFHDPDFSSGTTTGIYVSGGYRSSTEIKPRKRIQQGVQKAEASDINTSARGGYVIKPHPRSGNEETLPTSDLESSLSDLIDRFRYHPKIGFAERIAARLGYLLEISREEQPWQAPPAAASLDSFLAFLSKNLELAYPDVVLTPDGNVRAQWKRGSSLHFALEFLEDENVCFVIFAPDPKHPYKTVRVSGEATVDSVMEIAVPYKVLHWIGVQAA